MTLRCSVTRCHHRADRGARRSRERAARPSVATSSRVRSLLARAAPTSSVSASAPSAKRRCALIVDPRPVRRVPLVPLPTHNPFRLPALPQDWSCSSCRSCLIVAIGSDAALPLISGRSPHIIVHPEQIEVGLDRDQGARQPGRRGGPHARRVPRVRDVPRRARRHPAPRHAVRGPARHRQDLPREGDGEAGGVPFLFISAPAFQSMWYGMTASRIRSFFKALRKAARKEGGAIGFIEEIDAIGRARGGMAMPRRRRPDADGLVADRRTCSARRHRRHGQRAADPDAVVRPAAVRDRHAGLAWSRGSTATCRPTPDHARRSPRTTTSC